MPWVSIVLADLNDQRVAELVTALRQEALGQGQTDPMPRRIQAVVDEIRRAIAFCPSTPIDSDATKIPVGLKECAVAEIIGRLKARLQIALSDDEVRAEKRYWEILEKLQKGEWPVDKPDTPIAEAPVAPASGVQVVSSPSRPITRESLAGL